MLKSKKKSFIDNEKGSAMIEIIPIIIVIVTFLTFSIGFFGAIHSGILNSMAARNYAFETFRHRSNLVYFRSTGEVDTVRLQYSTIKVRVHGINSENSNSNNWIPTTRAISFNLGQKEPDQSGSKTEHNQQVRDLDEKERNERVGVNPIWLKSTYGICLNATCGA